MRIRSFLLRSVLSFALLAGLVPAPARALAAPAAPLPRVAVAPGSHETTEAAPDHILVAFKDTSAEGIGATAKRNGLAVSDVRVKRRGPAVVKVPKGRNRDELIAQLRRDRNVEHADPDYIRHVLAYTAPDDPAYTDATTYSYDESLEAYGKSWWLRGNGLSAESAWSHGYSDEADRNFPVRAAASAFKVGVIDTGFYMSHADRGNVVAGHDFFDHVTGGVVYEDDDVNPVPAWINTDVGDRSHGTCTAGEIAAATHNGVGVASVGYDAQAIMYKVEGYDTVTNAVYISSLAMIDAIERAADDGCRVISISIGGSDSSSLEQAAVDYAYAKGCVIVAATGNGDSNGVAESSVLYPAGYNHVVGVGAYASRSGVKAPTSWSNYGTGLDIMGPGDMIWGLTDPSYNGGYMFWMGTSMSTPAVAGAIAHLWRYVPFMTADQIVSLVEHTAIPGSTIVPNTYTGWGYASMASAMASITATYPYLAPTTFHLPPVPPLSFTLAWDAASSHPVTYAVSVDGSHVGTTTGLTMPLTLAPGPHLLSLSESSAYDYGTALTTATVVAIDDASATPPDSWGPVSPTGWVTTRNPTVSITARDATYGLEPSTAQFRYTSNGGASWSAWQAATMHCTYYSTATETISAVVPFSADSATADEVQFRVDNGANLTGTSPTATVRVDGPPTGSLTLDGGASSTTTSTVRVTSAVSDLSAMTMRLSGDGGATWSAWTPYTAEGTVRLAEVRGTHVVAAQYRDALGSVLTLTRPITYALPYAVTRLGGTDRYDTAILTSRAHFAAGSADTVVIATGEKYPDALSASALAGSYGAPLLLTPSTKLYAALPAEIARLGATHAILVGSGAAVATSVADAIDALPGVSVRRVAGVDRYATSKAIALEVKAHETSLGRAMSGEFFLARGDNFPDALALSPLAYGRRMPIVLTRPTSLPSYARDAIQALQPVPSAGRIVIAGDKPSVGDAVTDELDAQGRAWVRVHGPTRYDTAAAIASYGVGRGWASWRTAGVATGASFPDALGGGAAIGSAGGVLLLTQKTPISTQCLDALSVHSPTIVGVDVFGGTPTIAEDVVTSIRDLF